MTFPEWMHVAKDALTASDVAEAYALEQARFRWELLKLADKWADPDFNEFYCADELPLFVKRELPEREG